MSEGIRLNKYLAERGICSRREADRLIAEGRVLLNGSVAEVGARVEEQDEVSVDGKALGEAPRKVVLAYYKPAGLLVSEKDPHAERTVADEIRFPIRVTYAGRLDKDSEGLILLTNDGDLIHAMMQGKHGHEKEYIVHLSKEPTAEAIEKLKKGVYLKDLEKKTKPCRIDRIGGKIVRMVLTEGLNRQIRRMWEQEGYRIRALKRTRVVDVGLGTLEPGEYSELSESEKMTLYHAVGLEYRP